MITLLNYWLIIIALIVVGATIIGLCAVMILLVTQFFFG